METLEEFLKDLSSFQNDLPYVSQSSFNACYQDSIREPSETMSNEGEGPKKNGQQMSLEDLLSVTDPGMSSPAEEYLSVKTGGTSPELSIDRDRNYDMSSLHTAGTSPAMSMNQRTSSVIDLSLFEDAVQIQAQDETSQPSVSGQDGESDWEIMLAETANKISATQGSSECDSSAFSNNLDCQPSTSYDQSNCNNPFLTLGNELSIIPFPAPDPLFSFPTFQATPTFSAQNPDETSANDLFDLPMSTVQTSRLVHEQQLWLQTQKQIIAKHLS